MAGHIHPKWCYQFVENFGICSQKVNFFPHVFEAIAKICEVLILGTLGKPDYAHPKSYYQLQCLSACQKRTSLFASYLRYTWEILCQ